MFTIDKKFNQFELDAYDPLRDAVVKITSEDVKGKWLVLFFYPADFTFVCPTELRDMSRRDEKFRGLNAEVVVVSTDTVYTHKGWFESEQLLQGFMYRMAADHNGKFSRDLGVYDEEHGVAQRAVFIVDPDGVLRAVEIVADSIGRNAGEILRKLKALDFVRKNPGKVCPASWDDGAQVLEPSIKKAGKVYQEYKKE